MWRCACAGMVSVAIAVAAAQAAAGTAGSEASESLARTGAAAKAAARIEVTGDVRRSPALGATAPDGMMGGLIPSAAPGFEPTPGAGLDDEPPNVGYTYIEGRGWIPSDEVQGSGPAAA